MVKMPQSKKVPRNETYKESLLRKIASGDPSYATVAQSTIASKASPSTMRSANTSTAAASKGSKEISPANTMSSDPERDAVINPSATAKSPQIELKFSKIVSMALLIGPDLKPRVTTSSSTKDTAVKISKVSDKTRSDESTINPEPTKKARTNTEILSGYHPSDSTEKRRRNRMTKLGFSDVPRKATPLPISEKQPLNSEDKFSNAWKATTKSSSSLRYLSFSKSTKPTDLSSPTKNPDIEDVSKKNTPPEDFKANNKKRKSEATTPSKPAKKARKNAPANEPDKSPLKLHGKNRNTSKKMDLDNTVDLTTPTRRKSSPALLSIPTETPRKPRSSKLSPQFLNTSKKSGPNNTVDLITPPGRKLSATFLPKPKTSIFALRNPTSS
jgi:hypothetical protein